MKIAIPVDERKTQSSVCVSFGRTPYYLIYDEETKGYEYLSNEAAASQGGAGIKAAQAVVDANVGALLTPRCGENAAQVLKSAGIRLYRTAAGSAEDNISAYLEGKLQPLLDIHPGYHGHGGQ